MQPDPSYLIEKLELEKPLVGLYDAPDAKPFEPTARPRPLGHACIFAFYKKWQTGHTLQLTPTNYGCGGASHHLFDQPTRSREDFEHFLCDTEGLKADIEIMREWVDHNRPYKPDHGNLFIGPLKPDQYEYLKTVSFMVNPDQLSMLMIGAQYYSTLAYPEPVIAPFGSDCMLMVSLFESLSTNTGLWITLLFLAALLFIPIFPILTKGPLGLYHIVSGILLFLSGIRALSTEPPRKKA